MFECVGRKIGSTNLNELYHLKTVSFPTYETLSPLEDGNTICKLALFNEWDVLSLLDGVDGVSGKEGFYVEHFLLKADGSTYKDDNFDVASRDSNGFPKPMTRITLALDYFKPSKTLSVQTTYKPWSHLPIDNGGYETLEEYNARPKKFSELRELEIFHKIVKIVVQLHRRHVAHCSLNLGNIYLNCYTKKVMITGFGSARNVYDGRMYSMEILNTRLYLSPDVDSEDPNLPKALDVCCVGIILYTLLFKYCPYANISGDFNANIAMYLSQVAHIWTGSMVTQPYRAANKKYCISEATAQLLKSALDINLGSRPKIEEIEKMTHNIIQEKYKAMQHAAHFSNEDIQRVPDIDDKPDSTAEEQNSTVPFELSAKPNSRSRMGDRPKDFPMAEMFGDIRDHDYFHVNYSAYPTKNSFNAYRTKPLGILPRKRLPRPYIGSLGHFHYSTIRNNINNQLPLFLQDAGPADHGQEAADQSSLALANASSLRRQYLYEGVFDNHNNVSNFSITQVKEDIRPLKRAEAQGLNNLKLRRG